MMQIGLTPTFEKSLGKLTHQEQSRVKQIPTDFMLNPAKPGFRLHNLNTKERRFCSISVGMDLRIIALRDNDRLVFCYVGHHDDAYDWANRRRVEVHPVTGAAQLVELEEVIREQVTYVSREIEAPSLFAGEDDDYLLSLGVPPVWLSTVKQVDTDGLLGIVDRLPEEAVEALFALADGERPKTATVLENADPFIHPDAQRRFWVASDQRALRQALDYPWNQWAVFLHPTQRDAVERNFGGPARVSGSAGTGKTIVALHRAAFLSGKFPEANILLTTYSRPLVGTLETGLNTLLGATGDIRRRIKVEHLHKYADEIASESGESSFVPVRPQELDGYIDAACAENSNINASKGFVRAEFDAVIDYWGIANLAEYQNIARTGRDSAMSAGQRAAIWPVFESVRRQMRDARRMTWSDLADAGRHVVEARRIPPFDHVIADEAQDFGPRELRFLMALAPAGAYSHFFTGDSRQRIYRYPFAWSRAGIDLRGRGTTLVVNYRTTSQIRNFSATALGEVMPSSEEEFLASEAVSLMSGPTPTVVRSESPEEESQMLADWLREFLDQGIEPQEIAVFARTNRYLEERVEPALASLDLPANVIGRNRPNKEGGITVGTLHSAKGLEFRAVAIVACDADIIPAPLGTSPRPVIAVVSRWISTCTCTGMHIAMIAVVSHHHGATDISMVPVTRSFFW